MKFQSTMGGVDVIFNNLPIGSIDKEGFILHDPDQFVRLKVTDLEEIVSFMKKETKENNEEQERQNQIEKYKNVITTLLGIHILYGTITFGDVFSLDDPGIEFCGLNQWCLNEGMVSSSDKCDEAYDKLMELKLI